MKLCFLTTWTDVTYMTYCLETLCIKHRIRVCYFKFYRQNRGLQSLGNKLSICAIEWNKTVHSCNVKSLRIVFKQADICPDTNMRFLDI